MDKTIRWKQRFQNLKKASELLIEAAENKNLNRLEMEGLVQRFELSFELAWKTIKDFLESKGISLHYPRDILKEAFQAGLLNDGALWLEMLDKRNILSHTYNEEAFLDAICNIKKRYAPEIKTLIMKLEKESQHD